MTTQLAEKAEVLEMLLEDSQIGYNLPGALLLAVNEHDGQVSVTEIATSTDVYEMLEDPFSKASARVSDFIAVVSCGWAAPLCDDTTPRQHQERRRIRIVVFANAHGMVSVLRFEDDPSEPLIDDSGHGSLADAIQGLFTQED